MILDVTAVAVLDNGKPRASGDDPDAPGQPVVAAL